MTSSAHVARGAASVLGALVLTGALAAPPASASTTLGSTATAPDGGCGIGTQLQAVSPPGINYTVPDKGVITSWSFRAGTADLHLKFKAFRSAGGGSYTVVGASDEQTVIANTQHTFPSRIPVLSGDLIGFSNTAGFLCAVPGGGTISYVPGDAAVGNTQTYTVGPVAATLPISAVIEPDVDGDGYGDETQDCLAHPGTHGPCDLTAPVTSFTSGPTRTTKHSAKYGFTSNEPGSTFECRLQGKGITEIAVKTFRPCTSPKKFKKLEVGKYKIFVRATDAVGNVGVPAKQKLVVEKP